MPNLGEINVDSSVQVLGGRGTLPIGVSPEPLYSVPSAGASEMLSIRLNNTNPGDVRVHAAVVPVDKPYAPLVYDIATNLPVTGESVDDESIRGIYLEAGDQVFVFADVTGVNYQILSGRGLSNHTIY